jgi:hypothetical protein
LFTRPPSIEILAGADDRKLGELPFSQLKDNILNAAS